MLVDLDADAAAQAAVELSVVLPETLAADLATADGLGMLREVILREPGGGAITCFEVVEHLSSFVGLLELLVELTTEHAFTAVLSVPNDAYFTIENPYHATMWGEGAFEELRRLLPASHVAAAQVPLSGSVLVVGDHAPDAGPAFAARADPVPSHFVVAFGPRAIELSAASAVEMTDLDGQRAWERQRESNLAYHEDELAALRDYVHELERALGRRPSAGDGA